jgi:hypothetical protein
MTILVCPMCPWRAGVVGGDAAIEHIMRLHIDAHCAQFWIELNDF